MSQSLVLSRKDILEEAERTVMGERVDQYGNPEDSTDLLASYWTLYLRAKFPELGGKVLSREDAALMMLLLKIARQECGEGKLDNFVDMAGYASIAGEVFNNTNYSKHAEMAEKENKQ